MSQSFHALAAPLRERSKSKRSKSRGSLRKCIKSEGQGVLGRARLQSLRAQCMLIFWCFRGTSQQRDSPPHLGLNAKVRIAHTGLYHSRLGFCEISGFVTKTEHLRIFIGVASSLTESSCSIQILVRFSRSQSVGHLSATIAEFFLDYMRLTFLVRMLQSCLGNGDRALCWLAASRCVNLG